MPLDESELARMQEMIRTLERDVVKLDNRQEKHDIRFAETQERMQVQFAKIGETMASMQSSLGTTFRVLAFVMPMLTGVLVWSLNRFFK